MIVVFLSVEPRAARSLDACYAFYYNCVNKNILIRIDVVGQGSDNDPCEWVGPWERVQIGESKDILNAYALGSGRCNI